MNNNKAKYDGWIRITLGLFLTLLSSQSVAVCDGVPDVSNISTTTTPPSTWFVSPVGDNLVDRLDLLKIQDFDGVYNYPKISFNNTWYVATAFNKNLWLNCGWPNGPTDPPNSCHPYESPFYCVSEAACSSTNYEYHPGEDWNATSGKNTDEGKPIHPIADGVVIHNGPLSGYGETLIILHKVPRDSGISEYITSFYGHMQFPSPCAVREIVNHKDVVGQIGRSGGTGSAHLHLEVRRGPIVNQNRSPVSILQRGLVEIDPSNFQAKLTADATRWPAGKFGVLGDERFFIDKNYYHPSWYLLSPPCHLLNEKEPIPSGFGASYHVFSSDKEDLLKNFCGRISNTLKAEIGNGSGNTYVWHQANYTKNSASWETPIELNVASGAQKSLDGNWIIGRATATLNFTAAELANRNVLAAYVCTYEGNIGWKCGCRDQASCGPNTHE